MNPITELRKQHGYSQKQLADILGIHQTAVSQWETGRAFPDMQTAQALALCFGVYMEDLLESSDYAAVQAKRPVSDTALKAALFGCDVDGEMLKAVKDYAQFLLLQRDVKAAFPGGEVRASFSTND